MKNKLTIRQKLTVGFMLFSMFFGAGNLIFPPLVGAQAGRNTLVAMSGLLLSAVVLPVLGIIAVARHGDMTQLGSIIHPKFGFIMTVLVCLLIGPIIAIPRTTGTSFEMTAGVIAKHMGFSTLPVRILYSVVFFFLAFLVARRPGKLKNILGKIMTPVLIAMIVVLFIAVMIYIHDPASVPHISGYRNTPALTGFVEGYQTMDLLAALNFGLVVTTNIEDYGLKDEHTLVRETIGAGITAGILLAVLYLLLSLVGMHCSSVRGLLDENATGADVLTYAIDRCFGSAGEIFTGAIFFIACFNVCCGLLTSCSEYFNRLIPRVSYRKWLVTFTIFSFFVSILSLHTILSISIMILRILYPVAIVLVILGLFIPGKRVEG